MYYVLCYMLLLLYIYYGTVCSMQLTLLSLRTMYVLLSQTIYMYIGTRHQYQYQSMTYIVLVYQYLVCTYQYDFPTSNFSIMEGLYCEYLEFIFLSYFIREKGQEQDQNQELLQLQKDQFGQIGSSTIIRKGNKEKWNLYLCAYYLHMYSTCPSFYNVQKFLSNSSRKGNSLNIHSKIRAR